MKAFMNHAKVYVLRGLLAAIPLMLSLLVLYFIYVGVDKRVNELFDQFIGYRIPGMGILFVLIALYLLGFLTSNVIGRGFFGLIEHILSRIPILNTTYHVGKQVASTLSLPEKQVFKKVVWVDFGNSGVWSIGFVTGAVTTVQNEKLLKVFLPTVPNPTTGFVTLVKESAILDPHWTIEEGVKTVVSGGIIGPDQLRKA